MAVVRGTRLRLLVRPADSRVCRLDVICDVRGHAIKVERVTVLSKS